MRNKSLTEQDIDRIRFKWRHMSDVGVLTIFLENQDLRPYFEALKNHRVLEIGHGYDPISVHFRCGSYETASGSRGDDGLTVLRSKPEASMVVVSFGIDDSVLYARWDKLCEQYGHEMAGEIRSVMNPFAIFVSGSALKYMGRPDIPVHPGSRFGGVYLRDPTFIL